MIVGAQRQHVRLHHDIVVFLVVGARILALAPLHQRLVVADAHDRRPTGFAAAVAGVVAAGGGAVVVEADVVTGLVRHRFGHVLLVAVAEPVVEDVGGLIVLAGHVEHAQVGEAAAAAAAGHEILGDHDAGSEHQVRITAARQRTGRRRLGSDIDVERRVVFGDALPDALDAFEFGLAEAEGDTVDVVGRRVDAGDAVAVVPCRAGRRVAVEIEIDGPLCALPAVQQEGLVEREHRGLCRCASVGGAGEIDGVGVDVMQPTAPVDAGGVVAKQDRSELVCGLAVPAGNGREALAEHLDRPLAAGRFGQVECREIGLGGDRRSQGGGHDGGGDGACGAAGDRFQGFPPVTANGGGETAVINSIERSWVYGQRP